MKHSSYLNTLTSILSSENLKLAFTDNPTAHINLQTRTIFLPTYTINVSGSDIILSERLICHEVAHALYTPYPRTDGNVCIYGLFDSDILNEEHDQFFKKEYKLCKEIILILDDIRIENLFIKKFKGVGNLFAAGWKKYNEARHGGNSGSKDIEVTNLTFLSRVNEYFKSNKSVFYKFTNEEQKFVDQISELSSVEDMLNLTYTIGNFLLKNKNSCLSDLNNLKLDESPPISNQITFNLSSDEKDDENGEKEEIDNDSLNDNLNNDQEDHNEFSGDEKSYDPSSTETHENPEISNDISEEEKNDLLNELQKNNEMFKSDDLKKTTHYSIETIVHKPLTIIPSKLFWDRLEYRLDNPRRISNLDLKNLVNDIYSKIQKNVNILNIEFHRLKKAKEHRKITHQPTGTLNLSKLHSYQTSKNLFKTLQKTPKGKNHEFIIYLDWSGSIWSELINLVKEVCTIITFCHKNQIKFRVFGFLGNTEFVNTLHLEDNMVCDRSSLIEFISSNDDFEKTIKKFLKLASGYQFNENFGIDLGNTPLYSVLMRSTDLFKQIGNSDKHINLMIFSDGSSDPYLDLYSSYKSNTKIFDQVTGKIYHSSNFIKINDKSFDNYTNYENEICFNYCFDRLKSFVPNLKITTIHIGNSWSNGFISNKNQYRKKYDNYIFSKSYHYTNFAIKSSDGEYQSFVSNFLEDNTKLIDIKAKETKQIIKTNLKKMNSSISRVLYKHIAEEIA